MASLDKVIEQARSAVDASIGTSKDSVVHLEQLSSLLNDRYITTGNLFDLNESICAARRAVDIKIGDSSGMAKSFNILSYRLQDRFLATEEDQDLRDAFQYAQKAVNLAADGLLEAPRYLNSLAAVFKLRYSIHGDIGDLQKAITLARKAVDVIATGDSESGKWLNNLGNYLCEMHLITGSIAELEEATRLSRQAIGATSDDRMKALFLNNLSAKLKVKATATGDPRDYEEAIQLAEQVLDLTPEGHSDQAKWLNNLAIHLSEKFDRTWDLADLQRAVDLASKAADLTPDGTIRALYLGTLADALNRKYEKMALLIDLEEAIRIAESALDMLPKHHSQKAQIISTLADLLCNRYLRKDIIHDLDRAIQLSREVVDARPDSDPSKPVYLQKLAIQLNHRSSRSNLDPQLLCDLEESIQLERKAIEIAAGNQPIWSFKNNLSGFLMLKYTLVKDCSVLEECICLQREALDETPEDHQYRAEMLVTLGYRLREIAKDNSGLEEASECFLSALQNANAPVISRTRAGSALLRSCPNKQKAYQAARVIMSLLPQLITRSHETIDKQHAVGNIMDMACNAAAVALQAGRPAFEALELLELGRGILSKYNEDMKIDPSNLQQLSRELSQSYTRLRDELDAPHFPSPPFTTQFGHSFQHQLSQLNRRHIVATELDDLIIEMRKLPGFEDPWAAPTEVQTRAAAKYGPIVVVNISELRCDALLIESDKIRALALPNLYYKLGPLARKGDLGSVQVLEWLWEDIAKPVLDTLGFSQPPADGKWPHIWWIPTELLTLFPLHAAGYHKRLSSETVLDRVVSSYTSSIRAIMRGRHQSTQVISSNPVSPRALLVGMQHTPGVGPLPFANKEIEVVHRICKTMGLDPILPKPRKEDVASYLSDCNIFHFAGHGHTDAEDPSNSHLCLQDWREDPLRVADLQKMNLRQRSPFLAYLSACGTGQIKEYRLVNESVHLISAYQLAGFRHAIGTLWKVSDSHCVDMARVTYLSMRDMGLTDESVGWGLYQASRELRDNWVNRQKYVERQRNPGMGRNSVLDNEQFPEDKSVEHRRSEDPRDILEVTEEESEVREQLQWAPYVHFGV
ncbi:uncharacterized protein FTOL_06730 [Fusarium torulosum]|uniref:CHAT domain-containing protein n=1 Tax=Fusarium torulosum TaxID=33205 RepID=A0AAE8M9S4_9HYPO|nr:uncharacterized protein FTOL_06730 [Fusarium torulosum]